MRRVALSPCPPPIDVLVTATETLRRAGRVPAAGIGLGLGGAPRGELITGCGTLDQPPDQPASAQRHRRKHVLATVATGLSRGRGPIVRASLRKAPDSCPHLTTFKPILLLRPSRKASSWTRTSEASLEGRVPLRTRRIRPFEEAIAAALPSGGSATCPSMALIPLRRRGPRPSRP